MANDEDRLPCCSRCEYCSMPLPRRHEHDHFPIPKACGGTEVVPACMNCHEIKDRMRFVDWNPTLWAEGLLELINGRIPRYETPDAVLSVVGDYRKIWATLSPSGRLVYAKIRSTVEHHKKAFPGTLF